MSQSSKGASDLMGTSLNFLSQYQREFVASEGIHLQRLARVVGDFFAFGSDTQKDLCDAAVDRVIATLAGLDGLPIVHQYFYRMIDWAYFDRMTDIYLAPENNLTPTQANALANEAKRDWESLLRQYNPIMSASVMVLKRLEQSPAKNLFEHLYQIRAGGFINVCSMWDLREMVAKCSLLAPSLQLSWKGVPGNFLLDLGVDAIRVASKVIADAAEGVRSGKLRCDRNGKIVEQ